MSPFQIVILGLGVLALYSSVRDINPLALVKNTLQGKPPPASGSWSPAESESPVYKLGLNAPKQSGVVTKGQWPTKSKRVSQAYGVKNDRYVSGYHTGVDIDGECGDAIWSSTSGTISFAGFNGAYGLQVKVTVTPTTEVWYNHFRGIGAKVRPGQQVAPGTHLGSMGDTGSSTGCHLHFEVRVNGEDVDPMEWLS